MKYLVHHPFSDEEPKFIEDDAVLCEHLAKHKKPIVFKIDTRRPSFGRLRSPQLVKIINGSILSDDIKTQIITKNEW